MFYKSLQLADLRDMHQAVTDAVKRAWSSEVLRAALSQGAGARV
jgi:hypothetical protein